MIDRNYSHNRKFVNRTIKYCCCSTWKRTMIKFNDANDNTVAKWEK
jgi:hypothetical protein